jgi:hypothetical protein
MQQLLASLVYPVIHMQQLLASLVYKLSHQYVLQRLLLLWDV